MNSEIEEAKQLSWEDLSVYRARRQKAAVALVELAEMVRGDQVLTDQCADFLHCFDFLTEADSAAFTSLWSEPYAYYWSRTAAELSQQWRAGDCRIDSLIAHLDFIKLFASGLALLQGSSIQFTRPITVTAPLAIPGIAMTVESEQPVAIAGVDEGCLIVQQSGGDVLLPSDPKRSFSHPSLKREYCPLISLGDDATMRLHPAALKLPSTQASNSGNSLPSNSLQQRYSQSVEAAVACIEQHLPVAYSQLRFAARIVALKSSADGGPSNSSYSRLPGALLMSASQCGYQLAEDIIHESYHNRLYAIEEAGAFFENDRVHSTHDNRFYSAWRNDPRPLYGVFHAVYVFSRVQRFWLNVLQAPCTSAARREFAAQRCATLNLQLMTAVSELEVNADLTPEGETIFNAIKLEVEETRIAIDTLGLGADMPRLETDEEGDIVPSRGIISGVPVSVQQSIDEHQQLFEQNMKITSSI